MHSAVRHGTLLRHGCLPGSSPLQVCRAGMRMCSVAALAVAGVQHIGPRLRAISCGKKVRLRPRMLTRHLGMWQNVPCRYLIQLRLLPLIDANEVRRPLGICLRLRVWQLHRVLRGRELRIGA